MSPVYHKTDTKLGRLLDDHGAEGVSILASEPSRLMRSTIFVLFGLLVAGIVWSFFGRADVFVVAKGRVSSEAEQHRVYSPAKGELVNIYIAEGMPVSRDDVLVRIDSAAAIEVASRASDAKMKLVDAERSYATFPAKKVAMEKDLEALESQIETAQRDYERRRAESIAKLAEEQTLKLAKARAKLEKAGRDRDHAKRVMEKHKRLFASPGGGGVSRQTVEDKKKEYQDKVVDYKLAEADLGEFEVTLNTEYEKKKAEIKKKSQAILSMQAQRDNLRIKIVEQEQQSETALRLARAREKVASRISFDDIDENNFVGIRAPIDGVVTGVTFTQIGDKVEEKTPLAIIAPKGTRKILQIEVNERDRAFLRIGMPVKIKFNAFPYQRYGFISGELEQISPTTSPDPKNKQMVYKGRVGLERDYFNVNGVQTPLRYGMEGKAEIIVRKRRLIDLALDPFRKAAGAL